MKRLSSYLVMIGLLFATSSVAFARSDDVRIAQMSPDQLSTAFAGDGLAITYLSSEEMLETEGKVVPAVVAGAGVGATTGVVGYLIYNVGTDDGVTVEGVVVAAVTGAVGGAVVVATGNVMLGRAMSGEAASAIGALAGTITSGFLGRIAHMRTERAEKAACETAAPAP